MIEKSDAPKKVLIASTSFPLHQDSTSGLFVRRLFEALENRTDVSVLVPDDSVTSASIDGASRVQRFRYAPKRLQNLAHLPGGIPARLRAQPLDILLVPFFLLSYAVRLTVVSRKVDIVQANWAVSGALAGLLKFLGRYRLITTLRGEDVKASPRLINRFFLYLSVKLSDRIVVVSNDMEQIIRRQFPLDVGKIQVINNGVAHEYLEAPCAAISASERPLNLIFVGSLIERKNVKLLVASLLELREQRRSFHLNLVGAGAELTALLQFVEDNELSDFVTFHGELSQSQIQVLLRQCPIYVSASFHEGRPNSALEAMAAGCCLLLSDIDGHRELVGLNERGQLFNSRSNRSLSEALLALEADQTRISALGQEARAFVIREGLTWESCAEQYMKLFESMVD